MGGCNSIAKRDAQAALSLPATLALMTELYGKSPEQIGFTDGHNCVTEKDKRAAAKHGASLLYGEILPQGLTRLLDDEHMQAARAKSFIDVGCGTGKACIQAFLQYSHLERVVGVELAFSRYGIAERALLRLAEARPKVYEVEKHIEGELVRVRTLAGGKHARSIEFRRGDAWQRVRTDELAEVDVLLLHLEFTTAALTPLRRTLGLLHKGCRFVTYQDLTTFFRKADPPFQQIDRNLEDDDFFATSWSAVKGHHLFCWEKLKDTLTGYRLHSADEDDSKEEEDELERNKKQLAAAGIDVDGAAGGGGGGGGGAAAGGDDT